MTRPLLLVIDMQNDFLDQWPAAAREDLIRSTNELTLLMRAHGYPVVWIRQEFAPDLSDAFSAMREKQIFITIRGTTGCQVAPQLAVAASDPVVVKKRYSAFFQTSLEEILSKLQPDTLVLAGINTHACIRTTAIDAYQRDWVVVIARDCVGSYDEEHHSVTLRYLQQEIARAMSNQEIRLALAEER
ncbi:MAG TPA: isochorismatase family cysteine hydrolase [Bryobacteraceae bacterium]|jgi:nicotinamidase-related amidase|nr:isochorismatase family cysteine hydrolase [Bryobacteraceae bacterium]